MRWFFRKCSDWWKFDPEKQKCWLCECQLELANQTALLWLGDQWGAGITRSGWPRGDESETLQTLSRGYQDPGHTLLTTEADKYYLDCDTGDSRLMKRRVAGRGNMGRNATITPLSSTNQTSSLHRFSFPLYNSQKMAIIMLDAMGLNVLSVTYPLWCLFVVIGNTWWCIGVSVITSASSSHHRLQHTSSPSSGIRVQRRLPQQQRC